MGSGKGKVRRSQAGIKAAPPSLQKTWCDASKWVEFIEDNGLEDGLLYEYYLGANAAKCSGDAATAKVFSELFADAVTVGAINLPEPYVAADFEFQISSGAPHGWVNRAAKVVLKGEPGLRTRGKSFPVCLHDETEMRHHHVDALRNYIDVFFGNTVE